jgi:hypothetical protein
MPISAHSRRLTRKLSAISVPELLSLGDLITNSSRPTISAKFARTMHVRVRGVEKNGSTSNLQMSEKLCNSESSWPARKDVMPLIQTTLVSCHFSCTCIDQY